MRKRFQTLKMIASAAVLAALCLSGARAEGLQAAVQAMRGADVMVLGEVHDNPQHHLNQAALLQALQPKAVVWEMITQAQAAGLDTGRLDEPAYVAGQLDWAQSGWPDFSLYAPVFAAANGARQYGALVPRAEASSALQQGVAVYFGPKAAARFGLDQPLPAAEQAAREADQLANHCNAMPAEMLPVLVDFQRLRDAALVAAAEAALKDTGGPVAVITGNGHARSDRGLPVYLAKARPSLTVVSLGQSEGGSISGVFDRVLDSAPVERPDPCLAFRNSG
ncbi:lipoprotein [Leisingera sp. ANG-M1]|uniref:ChaN family lipoprotein n=1 Tax=Leisingera sp. ANG-M1 TaxID=1577895 RepID=UPI00057F0E1B|nr:ChaN family lipoprotein [Leisingera sp. ANG-M1]KIC10922.1 lipoprotein [Leisingera sp. ANG-M1]